MAKRALIVGLALAGLAAIAIAVGMRTLWLPESTYTASTTLSEPAPAIVTAPGVMEMLPGPALITARNTEGGPVFIARAREQDAQAWVAGAHLQTITGTDASRTLLVDDTRGDAAVPDPATADLWVDQVRQDAEAKYTWRDTTGRYVLVITADGTSTAPIDVTITWPRPVHTPWVVPLFLLGAVLLAVAVGQAVAAFARARRAAAHEVAVSLSGRDAARTAAASTTDKSTPDKSTTDKATTGKSTTGKSTTGTSTTDRAATTKDASTTDASSTVELAADEVTTGGTTRTASTTADPVSADGGPGVEPRRDRRADS